MGQFQTLTEIRNKLYIVLDMMEAEIREKAFYFKRIYCGALILVVAGCTVVIAPLASSSLQSIKRVKLELVFLNCYLPCNKEQHPQNPTAHMEASSLSLIPYIC